MTEADELLTDLRAVYGEMFPHRRPEAMQYTDTLLALGVLLRRKLRSERQPVCAPLAGVQTLRSFTPRGRILDALAELNPEGTK